LEKGEEKEEYLLKSRWRRKGDRRRGKGAKK
jgi:hypothetical protein